MKSGDLYVVLPLAEKNRCFFMSGCELKFDIIDK